ncbi:alpha/beta fold hydrolase [Bradyrhizobium sp. STM 3562]|uniref:alpha/beta fold hydrolase n=1 Tax=Bradyrhizobium sp. STM 3562 TaxID=578924 RepID=UPI00388DE391
MQSLRVNGYDMAYLDIGRGRPLVCVHGSLCDFRVWSPVLGPLTARGRVIALSLRHFFPENWDGSGNTYSLAQHIDDMIAFIEQLDAGPVDLMGHSRGGHICFRVAQRRPDLLRKLILAEPGGEIDASLDSDYTLGPWAMAEPISAAAERIAEGDIDGGLEIFLSALHVPWKRLPAAAKQLLRDNATTLIGDARDARLPFAKSDAESIRTPTLFIGGGATRGLLAKVLHTLAAHVAGSRTEMIAGATHSMFEQAPQAYSKIVLDFLAE